MSSPRRWRSTAARASGSPSGSPTCSATPRSCCCSTTASTSSTRSPSWSSVCSPACPRVTVVATSRERLRVPGEQLCAVPTLPTSADDGPGRASCSSSGRAPCARASTRRSGGAGGRSPRSSAGSTGCRWPSSWPRRGCTRSTWPRWPPGSTSASSCCRRATARPSRHGSLSAAVSWSFGLLDDSPATDVRRPVGVRRLVHRRSTRRRSAASTRRRPRRALDQLVERSLVMRAPDRRYVLLETLRAFGAEQLAADGTGWTRRASATLGTTSSGSRRADRRLLEPARHGAAGDRRRAPGAAHRARLAARPRRGRARRPPGRRACSTTASCGCGPTSWRGPSGSPTPTPTIAARWRRCVWAVSGYAAWMAGDVDETGVRAARALRVARAGGRRRPVRGGDDLRQLRAVRGAPRRGGPLVPAGRRRGRRRSGPAPDGGEHRAARPRLRR